MIAGAAAASGRAEVGSSQEGNGQGRSPARFTPGSPSGKVAPSDKERTFTFPVRCVRQCLLYCTTASVMLVEVRTWLSIEFKLIRSLQCTTGFNSRLHQLLSELERNGQGEIMSWQPHGKAFRVNDKERFVKEVLPLWFRQTRYTSFNRQLNLYGFQRFSKGTRVRHKLSDGMRSLRSYRDHHF